MPSTADRLSHIFRFLLFCCFYKGQSSRPEGYKWRYYTFWFWLRVVIRWMSTMSTLSKSMQVIRRNCFKIVFLASSANILWQCLISSCLLTISHFKLLTVWPTPVAAFIFPGAAKGCWWYTWAKGGGCSLRLYSGITLRYHYGVPGTSHQEGTSILKSIG